ncbi:MAG: hypothetical protein AAGN82_03960 [Myxococcota bacterium]
MDDVAPPVVWVLNLDADRELALGHYQPSAAVAARMRRARRRVLGLVRPDDVVLDDEDDPEIGARAKGRPGYCWCPTPRARRALRRVGARRPWGPELSFDLLRRVNHRRFCAELGQTLPGALWCEDRRAVVTCLVSGASDTDAWLLKRPYSFSGSGRRRVSVDRSWADDPDLSRWIDASLRRGGLQVEPWCQRTLDVVLHGFIGADDIHLGAPCVQECDAHGAWQTTRFGAPLTSEECAALRYETTRAGAALRETGYRGPFAVDAFRHAAGFCPRVEINARYTMGWGIGLPERPDLVRP